LLEKQTIWYGELKMDAEELANRIGDLLDMADSAQDAIYALSMAQYTVWAATHCETCKKHNLTHKESCASDIAKAKVKQ